MAIRAPRTVIASIVIPLFLLSACGSEGEEVSETITESTEAPGEEISDAPTEAAPAETTTTEPEPSDEPSIEPEDESTAADDLAELDGLDVTTCVAPAGQEFYVDVALDDPDGGLNMRTAPGIEQDIVGVFPRSSALVTTGSCATLSTTDWWKVTSVDGALDGWVASRYLSEFLVFNPGVGKAVDDLDNVGVSAESLDSLAAKIAESYGFDDDVVITMTSDAPGIDAQGGLATFEMTGLKDDASNGYLVDITFLFDKDEDAGGEIVGVTVTKVTNYALCTRGVTDDGLCV